MWRHTVDMNLFFYIYLWLQCSLLLATKLERFSIPEIDQCNSHFREVSAAIVTSSPAIPLQYQDSPCYLKFSSDATITTRKRLILKFGQLRIDDARVKLKIFDGRSQLSQLLHEFNKGSSPPVNVSESSGNFFTLQLDLGGAPAHSFAFTIYVTAVSSRRFCADFKCANGHCINNDLVCDNVDSCFDGTDEASEAPAKCKPDMKNVDASIEPWVIGLIVIISIVLVFIIAICVFCCFRRDKSGRGNLSQPSVSGAPSTQLSTAYHVAPTSESNGQQVANQTTDQETVQFL